MQMNSSHLSRDSADSPQVSSQQLFAVVLVIVLFGAAFTFGFKHFSKVAEDRAAKELCRVWAGKILADAKQNPPEIGIYTATLLVEDSWGQPLISTLVVEELRNTVTVVSTGRDHVKGILLECDDQFYQSTDIHVRKSLVKGIESGTHAAGKGFTTGIIEGLGQATDASFKKAKAGAKKVKSDLMNRFKKKESNNENG